VSEITAVVTTVAVAGVTKANTKAKRIKSWRMLVSPGVRSTNEDEIVEALDNVE